MTRFHCSGIAASPLAVILIIMVCLFFNVNAQSGCTSVLVSLSPCLNYVTGNSSTPTASCCTQLAAVVRSKPECLCSVLDGSADASLGISIDRNLALQLPNSCNVKTPPASKCADVSGPSAPPGSFPTETSAAAAAAAAMKYQLAIGVTFCLVLLRTF